MNTITLSSEPFLEPYLRRIRISKVIPLLRHKQNNVLLDIGCGYDAKFLLKAVKFVKSCTGIDPKAPILDNDKITTLRIMLNNTLPFPDNSFDIVTMLAVLEHLSNPYEILNEIFRILKPNGIFTGTVPSTFSKPILEFLSFRLKILNPNEILDHKIYYNKKNLTSLLSYSGFSDIKHHYFQLMMNNFFYCTRN